ncbi:MAG TPA: dihydroneopterin aldolase [Bacteroidales bacterium]|nr:dihydroneopterin aldolase [Bacteroidales bacterium]
MARIILEDMEFYAHHGCFLEERLVGARFIVNIAFDYNSTIAQTSDLLDDAVNYQQLYKIVKSELHKPNNLIEAVAQRIQIKILQEFPEIRYLKVRLAKLNPPVGGKVKSVAVELEKSLEIRKFE